MGDELTISYDAAKTDKLAQDGMSQRETEYVSEHDSCPRGNMELTPRLTNVYWQPNRCECGEEVCLKWIEW